MAIGPKTSLEGCESFGRRSTLKSAGLAIAVLTIPLTRRALAQEPQSRRDTLREAGRLLRQQYVSADGGAALDEALRRREAEFLAAVDDRSFAEIVTVGMRNIVHDAHLRLIAPGGRPPMIVLRPRAGPPDAAPRPSGHAVDPSLPTPRPSGTGSGPHFPVPVVDIRLLNQNIGYVHVSPLVSTDQMVAAVAGSINQLRRAKAVIFDVRDVPGGDPGMVTRLCGYVVSEPKLLLINQVRGGNQQPRWTVSDPAGPRLGDVPVAVVMNGRTASAGEALAFGLRGIGRATLIGERTRGAGNSGSIVPLPAGFSLWLPTGRSFDPRTGQGWEGTGVLPDIVVSGDAALSEAIKFLSSSRPRA